MKLISMSIPAIVLLSLTTGKTKVITPSFSIADSPETRMPAIVKPVIAPTTSRAISSDNTISKSRDALAAFFSADVESMTLYEQIFPEAKSLSENAFLMALRGYHRMLDAGQIKNTHVITIIDYTLSSLRKRLFVVDVNTGKLLYNTYVSHGMNSGKEYAHKFSNSLQSFESSLGFYVTLNPYFGKNGLALKLKGVEKGINDNAARRGIVIHGAPYVSERYGQAQGFMGRSEGCPALPKKETARIIHAIQHGSLIFAYYPSNQYLQKTKLLAPSAEASKEGFYVPLP